MVTATVNRETKETKIHLELGLGNAYPNLPSGTKNLAQLDGQDPAKELWTNNQINTGIGFLDHMLEAFARHGNFALTLTCQGDLHVDQHHTVEDVGICLGQAFAQALGNCSGIERFGMMECPLDEALVKCVIDISGRPFLHYGLKYQRPFIGALDSSLLREFFGGFAAQAKWTIHLDMIRGENDHHIAEAAFKAFARATKNALRQTGFSSIPSTKGVL